MTTEMYNTPTPFTDTIHTPEDDIDPTEQPDTLLVSLNMASLVLYSLIFVFGLIGNGLVIWVIGFKMKKTVNTIWFLNLAAADFLFSLFLPFHITLIALEFHWPFGTLMCKVTYTVLPLNMFASVFTLTVISVDRCVSVVWPVWSQNRRNVRKASCVSICVWLLALAPSLPALIFHDTFEFEGRVVCMDRDDHTTFQAVAYTHFLVGFLIPFSLIVVCYGVIIHRLRRNQTLARRSERSFKIMVALIVTFFLCWAPFHTMGVMAMIDHVTGDLDDTLHSAISVMYPIATSLAFLNSCLNPVLYVCLSQSFKDKVRQSVVDVLVNVFKEEVPTTKT